MAETQDDGGQAFPQPVTVGPNDDLYPAYPGMSLRDWFAGTALPTVISDLSAGKVPADMVCARCAQIAFMFADAMIAERAKPLPTPSDE